LNEKEAKKDVKPKPQRVKKEKKDTTNNSNLSNASLSSTSCLNTDSMLTASDHQSASTLNDLNLIKMMMMVDDKNNKSTGSSGKKKESKKQQQRGVGEDGPSLIQLAKQNGRYKYSKEFLTQIREQRASFIDQIQPEVFKAYCYCMSGKYWDPEKYFDIVQFPGEFNKSNYTRTNSYNRSNSYKQANNKYPKKYTPNTTFNNKNNNSYNSNSRSMGTTPVAISHYQQDESPQPLQVPKNSPKFDVKSNKDKILESLGLNMNKPNLDADKILLGLIKKENSQLDQTSSNLMNILNNKQTPTSNILENLFVHKNNQQQTNAEKSSSSFHKYQPLILTAQELEMSQLNQEKLAKCKLPNEISMNKLEELQQSMESNDSFAYRQLVKNLSNHPLTSANNSLSTKLEASLTKLQHAKKNENSGENKLSWQVSNDGTNMLKQLLNLTNNESSIKQKKHSAYKKSSYKTQHRSEHLSTSQGSTGSVSTGSSPNDSGINKFPSVNPHDIEDKIVASALNQVLSKSPMVNSNRSHSISPKSPIEDLINKINVQKQQQHAQELKNSQQHEHFNSLLSKINSSQQQMQQQNDILKWFSETNKSGGVEKFSNKLSAQSLSEIEFIEMHPPRNMANKLY